MLISYKKLWKLLIDKDLKKQDLRRVAQLNSSTVAKLTHGENVSTAVLLILFGQSYEVRVICALLLLDLQKSDPQLA